MKNRCRYFPESSKGKIGVIQFHRDPSLGYIDGNLSCIDAPLTLDYRVMGLPTDIFYQTVHRLVHFIM